MHAGREEEAQSEIRDGYYDPMQYYPTTNSFPPPPGTTSPYGQSPYSPPPIQQQAANAYQDPAYPAGPTPYNPADYAPNPTIPGQEQYYAHRDLQSPSQDYYDHQGGRDRHHGGNPENVSAEPQTIADLEHSHDLHGGCYGWIWLRLR